MQHVPDGLPKVESDDADLVVMALETAATLWENDDRREALRWLRKAAEAASDAGADLRSVMLAKAAADLATAMDVAPSVPAPTGTVPHTATLPWESQPDAPLTTRTSSKPPVVAVPAAPTPRQTERVAVGPGPKPGVLALRILSDGEARPEGTLEALLVAIQPGVNLT